jgi:CubicO group peptidase (beta-lactamase class C family)
LAVILVVGTTESAVADPQSPPPRADVARIDAFLQRSFVATRLAGMAAAIVHGDEVVHLAGYGHDGDGAPVTGETRFRVASLSKSFTAVAVHQLADAGKVDLAAPVTRYLPEFRTRDASASDRITVRDLLQQRSGMSDRGFPGVLTDEPRHLAERVEALRSARTVSRSGSEFHYFDPNYQVLARIVEVISGQPFDAYLRASVFELLGMSRSLAAETSDTPVADLAPGHVLLYGMPVRRRERTGLFGGRGLLAGSSGVVSTSGDMARWLSFQLGAGEDLVSSAAMTQMHTPPAGSTSGYAEGWQVIRSGAGQSRIEHTGVLSSYSSIQVLLPDVGYGFALLYNTNSMQVDTAAISVGLADLLRGRSPAGVRDTRILAAGLAAAALVVLGVRLVRIIAVVRGRSRTRGLPRLVLGGIWLLSPLALILAAPWLLMLSIDRRFSWSQLALSLPDVAVLLLTAAVTGIALLIARILQRRSSRSGSQHRRGGPA